MSLSLSSTAYRSPYDAIIASLGSDDRGSSLLSSTSSTGVPASTIPSNTIVDTRVEVNQRALIDKILARYASANAVYRELLQNSNDANATVAEIYFTTTTTAANSSTGSTSHKASASNHDKSNIVRQVVYRNNGIPFRPQDWSRLQKIAEGNPDVSKVGAFGVGAYTMFSICEEPLVLSGTQALQFVWRGDALWCRAITSTDPLHPANPHPDWTTFVLSSRDPYPLPSLYVLV
jgi:hypothetical protein